jgi:hypothetical protein
MGSELLKCRGIVLVAVAEQLKFRDEELDVLWVLGEKSVAARDPFLVRIPRGIFLIRWVPSHAVRDPVLC